MSQGVFPYRYITDNLECCKDSILWRCSGLRNVSRSIHDSTDEVILDNDSWFSSEDVSWEGVWGSLSTLSCGLSSTFAWKRPTECEYDGICFKCSLHFTISLFFHGFISFSVTNLCSIYCSSSLCLMIMLLSVPLPTLLPSTSPPSFTAFVCNDITLKAVCTHIDHYMGFTIADKVVDFQSWVPLSKFLLSLSKSPFVCWAGRHIRSSWSLQ